MFMVAEQRNRKMYRRAQRKVIRLRPVGAGRRVESSAVDPGLEQPLSVMGSWLAARLDTNPACLSPSTTACREDSALLP
jgi:hypothetical protein